VTILELGGMFAAPFGATVLADLGARVIKVEPLAGDTIRDVMAFPEAGGGKVLQGKESIALDIRTPEGLAVVHEIARRCDVVLQCYRAGVAARIGIDEAALKAVNPSLVYLNAPGYGIDGPYGGKPAYAPSIGAASGVSLTDAPLGGARPESHEQLLSGARNLRAGGTVPAVQSDGIAALGVASALLLGLYARRRGIALTGMVTTMLGTCTQALISRNTSYQGRPRLTRVDDEFRGLGPLYRLYRTADGWIALACLNDEHVRRLVRAVPALGDDGHHGPDTAAILAREFASWSTTGTEAWRVAGSSTASSAPSWGAGRWIGMAAGMASPAAGTCVFGMGCSEI